jgi:hypothetical protein
MKDPNVLNSLKAIIIDPSWKNIIVARLKYILDATDSLYHKVATQDDFRYYQGRYEMAKEIYELFKDGSNLAENGVQKMDFTQEGASTAGFAPRHKEVK